MPAPTIKLANGVRAALPDGLTVHDTNCYGDPTLPYDSARPWEDDSVEFWYTERFGWCIPTLAIGGRRSFGGADNRRTYGVCVGDKLKREARRGAVVTMGNGPHVLARITVYVRKPNADRVAPYLALRREGQGSAGAIRDRISTRRANTIARRAGYGW